MKSIRNLCQGQRIRWRVRPISAVRPTSGPISGPISGPSSPGSFPSLKKELLSFCCRDLCLKDTVTGSYTQGLPPCASRALPFAVPPPHPSFTTPPTPFPPVPQPLGCEVSKHMEALRYAHERYGFPRIFEFLLSLRPH